MRQRPSCFEWQTNLVIFRDRADAGARLGEVLESKVSRNALVFGLARGGVIVAAEICKRLGVPLGVVCPRKIGHPHNPEYAVGAVAEDGTICWNPAEVSTLSDSWKAEAVRRAREEAAARRQAFLPGPQADPRGREVVLVDDGIATGLTMQACIESMKSQGASRIIVAVPVAAPEAARSMVASGAEIVTLMTPRDFVGAIGGYYRDFHAVSDEEVNDALRGANSPNA